MHPTQALKVKVYAQNRTTVLATVDGTATSIGAARAAGVGACYLSYVDRVYAWVELRTAGPGEDDGTAYKRDLSLRIRSKPFQVAVSPYRD